LTSFLYASDEDALKAEDKTAKIAAEIPDVNISIINKSFRELSCNLTSPSKS
jgi:hypothetical protein